MPLDRSTRIFAAKSISVCRAFGQSGFPNVLLAVEHLDRLAGHDRRDGVLVDKLGMAITPQQYTEIVERRHYARQLHAIDQEYRKRDLVLSYGVEEKVLQILGSFRHFVIFHVSPLPYAL
jgi:hypothetical protein